ncbi:MAG: hypothetical protein VYD19_10045, partial [Myxococcota bacterium]|nr:hypothetical protein [Myxococcota bacterium]
MTRTDLHDKARPRFQPEPLLRLFDNPLLIAQARRQFRQRAFYFTWGFALLIGGAICLITHVSNRFTGSEEGWLVARLTLGWLIFINLYFRSATRLNGLAADERRSGLLEFHQATPTRPLTDAVGLLIGMNARAWVSGGVLSIFWLIAGLLEGRIFSELLFALFFIFFGALLIHSFCFTLGLWGRGGGRLRMGGLIFILPLFFFAEGLDQLGAHTLAHLTPFPALSVSELSPLSKLFTHYESLQFFGLSLSPRLFTLFVQGGALWICLSLACRSLSNPNQTLSRRGALIAWAATLLTVLGADLSRGNPSQLAAMDTFMSGFFGASAYLLLTSISGAGLLLLLSPTPLMLQQSERRAERLGRDRPQLIEDGAPISGALWIVMGVSVV